MKTNKITLEEYKKRLIWLASRLAPHKKYRDDQGYEWNKETIERWANGKLDYVYANISERMRVANEIYKRYVRNKHDR